MSASSLDKLPSRTPDQAREEIDRKDRQHWYRGRHASGDFGIIAARDGREVARCRVEQDREFLLRAAHAHDAMLAALEHAKANMPHPDQMIDDALALARGSKP